ncbi:MAG: hypothetical protein NWQ46_11285 [Spirosomaceae bacterium]|nr:hypothetical protein [Spirosomataceae bacterium]
MLTNFKSLPYATKFSIIAFAVTGALGLLSMGALGLGLYYPVSMLFKNYPTAESWHGDWVWPAMITAGMAWSFGFIFAGIGWHFTAKIIHSKVILSLVYTVILWLWAAFVWFVILVNNADSLLTASV